MSRSNISRWDDCTGPRQLIEDRLSDAHKPIVLVRNGLDPFIQFQRIDEPTRVELSIASPRIMTFRCCNRAEVGVFELFGLAMNACQAERHLTRWISIYRECYVHSRYVFKVIWRHVRPLLQFIEGCSADVRHQIADAAYQLDGADHFGICSQPRLPACRPGGEDRGGDCQNRAHSLEPVRSRRSRPINASFEHSRGSARAKNKAERRPHRPKPTAQTLFPRDWVSA